MLEIVRLIIMLHLTRQLDTNLVYYYITSDFKNLCYNIFCEYCDPKMESDPSHLAT